MMPTASEFCLCSVLMILEITTLVVWTQQTSQPTIPTFAPPPTFNNAVNGSVTVLIGETIIVEEDVQVIIDCSQLIATAISNITVIWLKNGYPITNGTAVNTVISADHRFCIITDTLPSEGGRKVGTDGDYTCKICSITTCINMTSPQITCSIPYLVPPLGEPIVLRGFISLTCGQDVIVPTFIGVSTLILSCSVFNGSAPLTSKIFKDGVLISNSFPQLYISPNDSNYGTYTFVVSNEWCGYASAVSRILRQTTNVTVIALDPQVVGQLLIVDCDSDVLNMPTIKNQIVGQSLILRCSVITGKFFGDLLKFTWSRNNTMLRTTPQTEHTQDHYFISQLNTSNDGQVYQCEVFVDTTTPVMANDTITLNLTVPKFYVMVSSSDSLQGAMVGDAQVIQCTVEVAFNGVELNSVIFKWSGPKGESITNNSRVTISPTVASTNTYASILQFSYLMEGDEGNYTCSVMILRATESNSITLIKLDVPTPNVSVVVHNAVIVGQPLTLECIVTTVRGINSQVNVVWSSSSSGSKELRRSNVSASMETFNFVVYRDYFNISLLTTDNDNITYACKTMINAVEANDSFTLQVRVPTPNVSFAVHNDMIVGQPFALECIANTVSGINSQVDIVWSNNSRELWKKNVSASITNSSSLVYRDYFNISQLTTDNDGEIYECRVIININPSVIATNCFTVHVIVPVLVITISPTGLVEGGVVGNNQTIQCTISTVSGVTASSVIINWIGPDGTLSNNDRIMISSVSISGTNSTNKTFSGSLHFMYLAEKDKGNYTCNISILEKTTSVTFTLGALIVPIPTVNITIQSNQTAGQALTLYCNVTTVRGITSRVDIMWLVDGSEITVIRDIDVFTISNGMQLYVDSFAIKQLNVTDNGKVYQCKVLINSDPLVMATDSFTLNVTGTPVADSVSDGLSISWIIGISVAMILLIVTIVLICLMMLRKRVWNKKSLNMKAAELKLYSVNNPSYDASIRSIAGISKQASIDDWKKQLAAYLIDYDCLDIKETKASGKFGVVYKAYYTSEEDNKIIEVAVKTIKYFSSQTAEDFIKECNIANKFDHPNVLSLIGVCIIPEEAVPLMVMPYMHHGDVRSFVKSKRENNIKVEEFPLGLSEDILIEMCLGIAKGMEYLAARHFVHRDLAARNCMLDQSMTVKVADFGLSRDVYATDYYTMSQSVPLPVKWLAPEALFDRTFSERTDVWAFGVTCWEVFSLGLQPYPLIGPSEIGDYIKSGKILDKPQLSSDEMYEIMVSCWKFEPEERPHFSELVKGIDHLKVVLVPQSKPQLIKKTSAAYLPLYS